MFEKFTCQKAAAVLSKRLDAPLPHTEHLRLRVHLIICDACRNVEHQFDFLRRLLRAQQSAAPVDKQEAPKPPH